MKNYINGVDRATGTIKTVALNYPGVLTVLKFYYTTLKGLPGYTAQDAELIRQAVVMAEKKITESLEHLPSAIKPGSCMHKVMISDNGVVPLIKNITPFLKFIYPMKRICPSTS